MDAQEWDDQHELTMTASYVDWDTAACNPVKTCLEAMNW